MSTPNGTSVTTSKAAIKELVAGRTKILEKLAGQLEKVATAKSAVARAQQLVDREAASARQMYQQAMDAGWTAAELSGAGLKPPAPPRRRSAGAEAFTGSRQGSRRE